MTGVPEFFSERVITFVVERTLCEAVAQQLSGKSKENNAKSRLMKNAPLISAVDGVVSLSLKKNSLFFLKKGKMLNCGTTSHLDVGL